MVALDLVKGDKIVILGIGYSVKELITRDIMKTHEERVNYYTYELESEDKNVTHAALDFFNKDKFIFHLTKKVKSEINEEFILIEGIKYSIDKIRDEIYIDAVDGDLREAKCYDVTCEKSGATKSELHIHGENHQIFYLNLELNLEDLEFDNKE